MIAPGEAAELLDRQIFADLFGPFPHARRSALLTRFATDIERLAGEWRDGATARDVARCARAGHSLIGAAGAIGAEALVAALAPAPCDALAPAPGPCDPLTLAPAPCDARHLSDLVARTIAAARLMLTELDPV